MRRKRSTPPNVPGHRGASADVSLTIDVEAVLGERRPAPEDAQMCRELRRRLFEDMAGTRFGDPRAVLTLEGLALQLWMARSSRVG